MANRYISQLPAVEHIGTADLFVTEQNGSAKKVPGQTLLNDLAAALDGHGGIASIEKTSSAEGVDTYTITFADETTQNYTVTNGVDGVTFTPSVSSDGVISWTNDGGRPNPPSRNIKGATGAASYVWIKWASQRPTSDAEMSDEPSDWMGIYSGQSSTAPSGYTSYAWYEVKGNQGDSGLSIGSITWLSNSSGAAQGTAGTIDTYQVSLSDGTVVGTFDVGNGLNGTGIVDSVCGVAPINGNVNLTADDVGAAKKALHITANITNSPATITNSAITSNMRVVSIEYGTPTVVKKPVSWVTTDGQLVLGDASTFSSSTTAEIILIETT